MADQVVQVQPDGAGKKIQTFENTVNAQVVQAQAVVQVTSAGAPISPALDATLTGGSAKAVVRGGAKGATTAADVTSTAVDANTQALDVAVKATAGLTDAQLRATAVPVSGPVTDAQLRAAPVSVDDGGGALTVDSAQLPAALAAGGGLKVEGVAGGVAIPVSAPTLTKGTQGAAGFAVQDLKDAGRQVVTLSWEEVAGTANVESALTNYTSAQRGGTALAAANNLAVTAGKTLRIQAITGYVKASGTANNLARLRLRANYSGAVANTSPILFSKVLGLEVTGTIAAGSLHEFTVEFPDGLEVPAGAQIAFTWITAANTCTVGLCVVGYEY